MSGTAHALWHRARTFRPYGTCVLTLSTGPTSVQTTQNARDVVRARALAACPSHARRPELLEDIFNSPGLPRIETHDAAQHFRYATRRTQSGIRQLKRTLRKILVPSWTLQPQSLMPHQAAPALRHAAREQIKHVPPPRKSQHLHRGR